MVDDAKSSKAVAKGTLPVDKPGVPPLPTVAGMLATFGLVGLTALIMQAVSAETDGLAPLLFLVSVLISATAFGFWTGLLAAAMAFAALNYLFTPPLYTFYIAQTSDLVALLVFLLVAGLAGLLAGRLHDRAEAARMRAEALAVLGALSSDLGNATTPEAALASGLHHLSKLGGSAVAVGVENGDTVILTKETLSPADLAAAERCLRTGRAEPAAAPGWPGAGLSFLSVAPDLVLGHARLAGHEASRRAQAITALAEQMRLALQRLDFADKARAERLRAEAEATRSAVLTSLSHDLRTPLATILGAASALKELDANLSPAARADLLTAIEEEAGRLNRHVTNLLHLTRLGLGQVPQGAWVDLNDIAEAAVARARRSFAGAAIVLGLSPDLPMIRSEAGLIEQALFNLIDNALHHGTSPIAVETSHPEAGLCLRVRDAGKGISQLLRDWLDSPEMRPAHGQRGLGLAVAKGIAQHLGGQLRWQDASFTLTLPEQQ